MGGLRVELMSMVVLLVMIFFRFESSKADISHDLFRIIKRVNKGGPYTAVIVARRSELQPIFDSKIFHLNGKIGEMDFAGRTFYIGHIGDRKMILAKTGKGMINAAITTQILCTIFKIKNILHYGLAGNADGDLNIGDIAVPRHWAHTGFWNWQKYGDGPDDALSFEDKGYFTRDYGYLNFGDYTNKTVDADADDAPVNLLNNIWYQPEEIFPVVRSSGSLEPSNKEKIFWIPVDTPSLEVARKLEAVKLEECININTCLPMPPKVVTVNKGSSASIYLDNVAYKSFLNSKFEVSPVDMEAAAIALVGHQHQIPFIAFKAVYELAGDDNDDEGSSPDLAKEDMRSIHKLLLQNNIKVVIQFILKYRRKNDIPPAEEDDFISST